MKTSKILIVLVAILSLMNTSSWAQETIITAPGEYVVPCGEVPNLTTTKIVVEKVDPSQVKIGFGWDINFWSTPIGHTEDNSSASSVIASLPGPYESTGSGGSKGTRVSYISDPWVKVDGVVVPGKEYLTDFNDPSQSLPVINAESLVELELSSVFANSSYSKGVYKDVSYEEVNLVGLKAQITQSGRYLLLTASGSSSPSEIVYFNVVITGSTIPSAIQTIDSENINLHVENGTLILSSATALQSASVYSISGQLGNVRKLILHL
ncbi:hypothetical protein AGMMS50262_24280 [Bacteroidia bacterium]|nr:hypothetical protein AGMMS50262_24280 [Bacteroidia bacterium]